MVLIVPVIIIILLFAFSLGVSSAHSLTEKEVIEGPYLSTSKEVFSYISNNTDAGSEIIFFKSRAMRLYANRQSIMIVYPEELIRGDYLCIYRGDTKDKVQSRDIKKLILKEEIYLEFQNKDFKFFKIK